MNRKLLLVLASVGLIAGCTLDDAAIRGEVCPDNQDDPDAGGIAYIENETCTAGNCGLQDFSSYFEKGICPTEYPYCQTDGKVYFCSHKKCEINEHFYDGKCVKDDLTHCGSHSNDCTNNKGWVDGECDNGGCIAIKCENNYIIDDNQQCASKDGCTKGQHLYIHDADEEHQSCEDDSNEHCGDHETNCESQEGWESGSCVWDDTINRSKCVAESCKQFYKLKNGQCVFECEENQFAINEIKECKDNILEDCGFPGINCTELEGWQSGECNNGQCVPQTCKEFYHIEDNECQFACEDNQHELDKTCEDNTLETCGDHDTNCTLLDGWADGSCTEGKCISTACKKGFHIYNNICEKDDLSNCGSHNTICAVNDGTVLCEDGKCKVNCNAGFHDYNTDCEQNTIDNCGKHGTKCTVTNGNPRCTTDGKCVASDCAQGYHSYNDECVPDDNNNCGGHGIKCNVEHGKTSCVNGMCRLDSCDTNFHKSGNSCKPDDTNNCGSDGTKCTIVNGTPKCENAKCGLKSCNTNYHPYNSECEVNSVTNCGSHGNKCTIANGTPKCENGICGLQACNANYHPYNNICEVNSITNCGSHGKACSYPNGVASCSNGQCKLEKCNSNAHNYNGACEPDSTSNCGSHGNVCPNNASCVNKKCVCNTNYHNYNGTCELNDSYHCGSHDNKCPSYSACNATIGQCVCQAGKHMYNNKCESDSVYHCGSHENVCPTVTNGTRKCVEGTCTFVCKSTETCGSSAYHKYGNTCEKNDVTNCGSHGVACTTATVANSKAVSCTKSGYCGQCRATSCISGYKLQDGACVPR